MANGVHHTTTLRAAYATTFLPSRASELIVHNRPEKFSDEKKFYLSATSVFLHGLGLTPFDPYSYRGEALPPSVKILIWNLASWEPKAHLAKKIFINFPIGIMLTLLRLSMAALSLPHRVVKLAELLLAILSEGANRKLAASSGIAYAAFAPIAYLINGLWLLFRAAVSPWNSMKAAFNSQQPKIMNFSVTGDTYKNLYGNNPVSEHRATPGPRMIQIEEYEPLTSTQRAKTIGLVVLSAVVTLAVWSAVFFLLMQLPATHTFMHYAAEGIRNLLSMIPKVGPAFARLNDIYILAGTAGTAIALSVTYNSIGTVPINKRVVPDEKPPIDKLPTPSAGSRIATPAVTPSRSQSQHRSAQASAARPISAPLPTPSPSAPSNASVGYGNNTNILMPAPIRAVRVPSTATSAPAGPALR